MSVLDALDAVRRELSDREPDMQRLYDQRRELILRALDAGVTQRQIAAAAGLSAGRVGQIATSRAPTTNPTG